MPPRTLTALPELREKVTGRAVPYPTRSRCRRTPPTRNQNHHENHAHQPSRNQPDDVHPERRLTPARGPGKRGKAPRASCGAGRVLAGGPALPEGKAGRAGRGVPGGDRRHALAVAGGGAAGPVPAGGAGWPAARDRRHPPSTPPAPSSPPGPARGRAWHPARATRRCGPVPARPGGDGPGTGRPPGGYREGGTVARTATVRATVVHAPATGGSPVRARPAARSALC